MDFKPEYMVGFPSSMIEIAKYGITNHIEFPDNQIKAIFPTAETVTEEVRDILESYFKTDVYDQYASSEGAPFIFECEQHHLHLELQSGIFEVLDKNNQPAQSGKLVVTSFTTHGTPLIRYDIGDEITLSDKICNCGNNNPLIERINGRIDDYIYAPETGKINLGNISNTLKGVYGIKKFQVIQNQLNAIDILIIIDQQIFNSKSKHSFIKNWRDRVGDKMTINLLVVDEIPNEKSGKFRLIKNNIKQLVK
jgi:phenylacetate-CoA ligase